MDIVNIIGWALWFVCAWFAFGHAWGIVRYTKTNKPFMYGTGITSFLFLLTAIVFFYGQWNKLHLIWILPFIFCFPAFIVPKVTVFHYTFIGKLLLPIYWVLMIPTRIYVFILQILSKII